MEYVIIIYISEAEAAMCKEGLCGRITVAKKLISNYIWGTDDTHLYIRANDAER
jgi:hypothetical protein